VAHEAHGEGQVVWSDNLINVTDAMNVLRDLPSAQPEHKTGRWIESNPKDSKLCRLMTCSECGKAYIVNINVPYEDWTEAHKFCVECGADMREEQE
jgi:NADH pyrophosphatase NudC (nudix superfamily)